MLNSIFLQLYDKSDCRELNLQNLRSQLALVSQEPILFNYSIRDNISYGLTDVTQEQIENAAKLANAHKFINETTEVLKLILLTKAK